MTLLLKGIPSKKITATTTFEVYNNISFNLIFTRETKRKDKLMTEEKLLSSDEIRERKNKLNVPVNFQIPYNAMQEFYVLMCVLPYVEKIEQLEKQLKAEKEKNKHFKLFLKEIKDETCVYGISHRVEELIEKLKANS